MPFTLKPHQLVAHWIPGFVLLAVVLLADLKSSHSHFQQIVEAIGKTSAGLAFAVAAFAAGQFLDAFRNIIEELTGKIFPKHAINWNFIWEFNSEKLEKMDDFYFTYYVFDFNLALALVIGIAAEFLPVFYWHLPCWMIWFVSPAILVFVVDGFCLRGDIVKLSNGHPPHK